MLKSIFTHYIKIKYQEYLHQENTPDSGLMMLTFLLENNFINTSTMRHLIVPLEIERLMKKEGLNKSKAVLRLSTNLNYSESQIYNVLKSQ